MPARLDLRCRLQHPDAPLWLLLILALWFTALHNLAGAPLFDVDEGAFSEATREMFVRGDFIATYLHGQPRYDKPILFYWVQALGMLALGVNEWGCRLPSALATLGWTAAVYGMARHLGGAGTGLRAALVMASTFQIGIIARAATADALLNLLLASTLYTLYRALEGGGRRWLWGAAVLAGLGFLTKGPVALAIPAGVSFLYCLSLGRWRQWLRSVCDPVAWGLFLLIAAPWYLAVYRQEGEAFVQGFFFKHNLGRFQKPLEGHRGPLWYYLPVLVVGLIPYTAVLVALLRDVRHWWRQRFGRYALIWLAVVFALFSAAGTKLPHYLLYGYSGLWILLAMQVERLRSHRLALLPVLLFGLFLLALPYLAGRLQERLADPYIREVIAAGRAGFPPVYYLLVALGLLAVMYAMEQRRWPLFPKLAACGVGIAFLVSQFVMPAVIWAYQRPVVEAAALVQDDPRPLLMWRVNLPSFAVYTRRVLLRRQPRPGDLVLTKTKELGRLEGFARYHALYQKQGVSLVHVLPKEPAR